jgi:hypothetical protein
MTGAYPGPGEEIAIIEYTELGQPAEDVPPTAGIVVAADDPEFNQTFLRVLLGEGGHAVFWRGSGWLRTGADGESRRWRLQDRRDC